MLTIDKIQFFEKFKFYKFKSIPIIIILHPKFLLVDNLIFLLIVKVLLIFSIFLLIVFLTITILVNELAFP